MAESFLIPAGIAGLTKTDFDFRLYQNGTSVSTAAVTVTEVSGDYVVSGLDDGAAGEFWSITWSYTYVTGVYSWPAQTETPTAIMLLLPATGLALVDIGAVLLLDGVSVSTSGLTLTEVEAGRDYRLTGMSTPAAGSQYIFRWEYPAGVAQSVAWPQNVIADTIVNDSPNPIEGAPGQTATRWEESGLALGREFGEDVIFSLPSSLRDADGLPLTALVVKTAAGAGATSVVLQAASGAVFTGSIPAGFELTAPGETLTTSARATALGSQITVSLSSATTVALNVDDAVSVGATWTRTVPYCMVSQRKIGRVPAELIGQVSMRVTVPSAEIDFEIATGTRVTARGQTGEVLLSEARLGVHSVMVGR